MSVQTAARRRTRARMLGGVVLAATLASLANTVVAVVARAATDAPDEFSPLQPTGYVFFTVLGTFAGAQGWRLVRRFAHRPFETLRWLVPSVLLLSFIPDVILLSTDIQEGTTMARVLPLMLMHLVVAAIAIPIFRRFLPLAPLTPRP